MGHTPSSIFHSSASLPAWCCLIISTCTWAWTGSCMLLLRSDLSCSSCFAYTSTRHTLHPDYSRCIVCKHLPGGACLPRKRHLLPKVSIKWVKHKLSMSRKFPKNQASVPCSSVQSLLSQNCHCLFYPTTFSSAARRLVIVKTSMNIGCYFGMVTAVLRSALRSAPDKCRFLARSEWRCPRLTYGPAALDNGPACTNSARWCNAVTFFNIKPVCFLILCVCYVLIIHWDQDFKLVT